MNDFIAENWNQVQKDMLEAGKSLAESIPGESRDAEIEQKFAALQESMESVRRTLEWEDRGWDKWWGSITGENLGMELDEIKEASLKIREFMVGMPTIKRAAELREIYIWGKGAIVPGVQKTGAGRNSNLINFYNDPVNQASLFSTQAHAEIERALGSEGNLLMLGDDKSKKVRPIAFHEITGIYTNPDFPDEVWAYRREWTNYSGSTPKHEDYWYYTDSYPLVRKDSIAAAGKRVPTNKKYTIFDLRVNRQIGYPLGIPDLLSAVAWARLYSDAMKRGKLVQDALSQIVFKATASTPGGVGNLAAKIAGSTGAGNTFASMQGNDLTPLATAGKGYDFGSLQPIAAFIAQAAGVDIVNLLASPGAAGSSYGAASVLTPSTKKTAVNRQRIHTDYYRRIFKWATGQAVEMTFIDVDDPDPYRDMQRALLAWSTGTVYPEEIREEIIRIMSMVTSKTSVPTGVLLPNNEKSLARKDVDADGTSQQAGSPGQGVANGTGGQASSDLRTDLVSEFLKQDSLDRYEALVERMENAANRMS